MEISIFDISGKVPVLIYSNWIPCDLQEIGDIKGENVSYAFWRKWRYDEWELCLILKCDWARWYSDSRAFSAEFEKYKTLLKLVHPIYLQINSAYAEEVLYLRHNIPKLTSHLTSGIEALISMRKFSSIADFDQVKGEIMKKLDQTCDVLLQSYKYANAISSEMTSFDAFVGDYVPELDEHAIHKLMLNELNKFYWDFRVKKIIPHLAISHDRVLLDYATFSTAMYHFLNNAFKYCLPWSDLFVDFYSLSNEGMVMIRIKMTSMEITPDEQLKMFNERFRWKYPSISSESWTWIWMKTVKSLLNYSWASISVQPGPCNEVSDWIHYADNVFYIKAPLSV